MRIPKAANHRLLVKRAEAQKTTEAGLIIPDQAQEDVCEGIVLHTGLGATALEGGFRVGDTVFFGRYSGSTLMVDKVPYLILHKDDVLAFRENESLN